MTMHLLKERKGQDFVSRCGLKIKGSNGTTAWWTDVDCSKCLAIMRPAKRRRYKQ